MTVGSALGGYLPALLGRGPVLVLVADPERRGRHPWNLARRSVQRVGSRCLRWRSLGSRATCARLCAGSKPTPSWSTWCCCSWMLERPPRPAMRPWKRLSWAEASDFSSCSAKPTWPTRLSLRRGCENLQGDGQDAVAVSGATGAGRAGLLQVLQARHKVSLDMARRRGIQHAMLRCMVVGVPNVGKSTLINKLAGSARAKTGKRPGVTRGPQWVQLADGIELLDTPGVMLPGRLGPESLLSLAVTGTINEEVLPLDDLAPRPGGADPGSGLRLARVWGPAAASRGGTLARVAAGALPGSGLSLARQRARRAPRRPVSAQSPAGRPVGTAHPGAPRVRACLVVARRTQLERGEGSSCEAAPEGSRRGVLSVR